MRKLARRLFTLCWAVSLVLCVVVCVLWVRSYWVPDRLLLLRPPAARSFGYVVTSESSGVVVRAFGDYDPVTGAVSIATVVPPFSIGYGVLIVPLIVLPAYFLFRHLRKRAPNVGFDVLQ